MIPPISLQIPNTARFLVPGMKIKLGRFDNITWTVHYGWFSFGGNREICCWYITNNQDNISKPLNLTDLDDIIVITLG